MTSEADLADAGRALANVPGFYDDCRSPASNASAA